MHPVNNSAGITGNYQLLSRWTMLLWTAIIGALLRSMDMFSALTDKRNSRFPGRWSVQFTLACLLGMVWLNTYPLARPGLAQQASTPPNVLYQLDGSMSEQDWIGGGFGSLVTLQSHSYTHDIAPSFSWTPRMDAIGRWIASTGSYASSSGKVSNGTFDYAQVVYMDWINNGGLNFGWPGLGVQETTHVYVRGLAGTPFQINYQHNGVLTENGINSQFYGWSGSEGGVSQGYMGWGPNPKTTTASYVRTGTTSGDPVFYNGVAYTLATIIGAGGSLEQNGSYGGTHEGMIRAGGHIIVKRLVPQIIIEPRSLSFGAVTVRREKKLRFTIRNEGGAVLTGNVENPTGPFSIVSDPVHLPEGSFTVQPGQRLDVQVRFAPPPGVWGTYEPRQLYISKINDPDNLKLSISLAGIAKGAEVVNFKPTFQRFSEVISGSLDVAYAWDSSTGNLDDLQGVEIQEVLRFGSVPDGGTWTPPPPFREAPRLNPANNSFGLIGQDGKFHDGHVMTVGDPPYVTGAYNIRQKYQWRADWTRTEGNAEGWVDIDGATYTIERRVAQDGDPSLLPPFAVRWAYHIRKHGTEFKYNLSF